MASAALMPSAGAADACEARPSKLTPKCATALTRGVKITGCTVHFVDDGVDAGPIILQQPVPVFDNDTPESLHQRIQLAEHQIYPEAIRLFELGKLKVEGRTVRVL